MTISIEGLRNYSATVIRVPKVRKAENSDRLYVIDALGMTAIVDESWVAREGELALIFPAEVQLSPRYAETNNLYREAELNLDPTQSGYLEKNRRVRAMKLRGNISNGLVMPLESLYYHAEWSNLREGDVFDTVEGIEICRKYVVPTNNSSAQNRADSKIKKAFKRVEDKYLPQHFETGQWLREEKYVKPDEEIIITQKLHGTSCRLANTVVRRQLKWYERVLKKLGVQVKEYEYDLVAGSKKVIKDPNNPRQQHHYGFDLWSDALAVYGINIPKNFVVYGELVGYIPKGDGRTPIQQGHTYEEFEGDYGLYVYRVAFVTEDAMMIDLTWDQVRDFCERYSLTHVPELDRMPKAVFDITQYEEKDFYAEQQASRQMFDNRTAYTDDPVQLSEGGTGKDEGIAIRVERGLTPEIYKYKNFSHYEYETKQLDTGVADLESTG